jgi:hypothetical protein
MTTMLTTTARLIRQGATTTATYSRQTNRCISSTLPARGVPPVDYDHFTSGWTKDSSEYTTEGKFHIKTFNKISPLVSKIDLLGGIAVQQCLLSRERHVCFDMYVHLFGATFVRMQQCNGSHCSKRTTNSSEQPSHIMSD